MSNYVDGFVVAVPKANQQAYTDFSRKAWPMFQEMGALRQVEAWEDDVPDGKQTDFRRAVQSKPEEAVVFSWITWPDKATRDAAMKKMQSGEMGGDMANMPFDGMRMIFGGFVPILDEGEKV